MCGVFGVLSKEPVDIQKCRDSLNATIHRGPDNTSYATFLNNRLFLGHNRLSVLDLDKRSNQPFGNEKYSIIYNGEIYNFSSLKNKESYFTNSDTEVLFKGLISDGYRFLDRCQGMFAGAFWNDSEKKLTLFRDSLGIKPMYVYHDDTILIFSSEIKSIVKHLGPSRFSLNRNTFESYLTYENYNENETFFKNIYSLELGEIKEFRLKNAVKCIGKDSVKFSGNFERNRDLPLEVQAEGLIKDSVKDHLLSDVPVSVYMSGGIDSTLVSSMAGQLSSNKIKAFTGFFETKDSYYDESNLARNAAESMNIDFEAVQISPDDFIDNFDKLVFQIEQPRMGMGSFSQSIVSKKVSNEFKVVLSGHGGDELFGGYPLFLSSLFWDSEVRSSKLKILRTLDKKSAVWFLYSSLKFIYSKEFLFAPRLSNTKFTDKSFYARRPSIETLTEYYRNIYIPGLLSVEDKISMQNSLETRMPLWSQPLLSFIQSVDPSEIFVDGTLKGVLKKVAKGYIPDELITSPKRGFPTPLRIWFKNELKNFVLSRIEESNCFDTNKDRASFKGLFLRFCHKRRLYAFDERFAHRIWMFLNIDSWSNQYSMEVAWKN